MTFNELKLYIAIRQSRLGGADFNSEFERIEMAAAIMREWVHTYKNSVFPFSVDDILKHRMAYRKNKNTRIKVEVAIRHGCNCFWKERGKGECSDTVDCGHIVARSNGGEMSVENCMIECSAHNRQRGVLSIEDYVRSGLNSSHLQSVVNLNPESGFRSENRFVGQDT
jgi:hypothetical protein